MDKSFSIDEFCADEGISRSQWYVLVKQGKAPKTYRVGKFHRMTGEERKAWREARQSEAA